MIHRGNGYRVSVPFFYEPNFDALVKPLASCVERSGKPPIHEGNTYGEHLMGKVFSNFYSKWVRLWKRLYRLIANRLSDQSKNLETTGTTTCKLISSRLKGEM